MNEQVVGFIRQCVDDNVYHHVENETFAHTLWIKNEELYERKTGGNKAFLIRKLINLKFKEGTSIMEHLSNM